MTAHPIQGPEALTVGRSASCLHADVARSGKMGWAMLWLLGIPLPILLILYAIMG